MSAPLTIHEMQANVAQSRGHITTQEVIIARLADQGHTAMAAQASAILVTMHEHLATEIEMLARMESMSGHS